jgi:hypothetical protein
MGGRLLGRREADLSRRLALDVFGPLRGPLTVVLEADFEVGVLRAGIAFSW